MESDDLGLDQIRHWHFAVPKGRLIYEGGDAPTAFYRVDRGCVRLQLTSEDGRRQILAFCLPGDVFGLEIEHPHFESAEAAEDSLLTRFSAAAITDLPLEMTKVVGALTAASDMIAGLYSHLDGLGRGSAEERLLWFLHWLAARQGVKTADGVVRLPMNRRDIADFLGLAQETLSRTFSKLETRGRIEVCAGRRVRLRRSGRSRAISQPTPQRPRNLAALA